jgi:hypothetical protein
MNSFTGVDGDRRVTRQTAASNSYRVSISLPSQQQWTTEDARTL